ncbi:MAG: DUF1552 domain-containing protein, partial [Myxococcota bacterium]|nr:DUF1552 domain-containing protein [Myxococcota bacterium]
AQGDGPGDHARGTATFLTCVHPLKHASNLLIGPSIDQLIARTYDGQTRFSSLEIGCEGGGNANACDSGYSCAYSRNIAWRDATTPLPKETNPRLLFERLFGGVDPNATAEARALRKRRKQSVLDFVLADASALRSGLGGSDRARLDNYMSGIRDIEMRLESAENDAGICGPEMERPQAAPNNRMDYGKLMGDLMVAALRCDLTRVGTFMFANGGSNRAHTEAGMTEGHHELSHHQGDAAKLAKIAQIDAWEIGLLAHIIEAMSVDDGAGTTLLDHTTVFFGSEIADGNAHGHYDVPVIMAGRNAGLGTGQYVDLRAPQRNNQPIANLFIRILQDCGGQVQTFGDDGDQPLVLG